MQLRAVRDGVWLGLNVVVALIFLALTSGQWIEPELKDEPGASGGSVFVFALFVLYIVGPSMALNVGWLAFTARKALRERDWTPVWVFAAIAGAWLALVAFSASKL